MLESFNLQEDLSVVCEHWLNPQFFKIQAKVVVRSNGNNRKIGAEYSIPRTVSPENLDAQVGILPYAQESSGETKIIGEPAVFVSESDSATVKSGGELQYGKDGGKHHDHERVVDQKCGLQFVDPGREHHQRWLPADLSREWRYQFNGGYFRLGRTG